MQPVRAIAIEIKYFSGALMRSDEFGICKTFISEKGVIRTTFERNMKYSDAIDYESEYMLPVKVSYEYKLKNNVVAAIFEEFDLLELKQVEGDMAADDGGSWQITLYTNGVNSKLKGYEAPAPFGEELAEKIRGLIKYEVDPMIF
ncbi:hypothetical protein RJD24_21090 [Bacillaceae bacterium IKA-2]|nr:hypothetical protein RJD24_21090 [Bacillaceae bacterium IKA-2]